MRKFVNDDMGGAAAAVDFMRDVHANLSAHSRRIKPALEIFLSLREVRFASTREFPQLSACIFVFISQGPRGNEHRLTIGTRSWIRILIGIDLKATGARFSDEPGSSVAAAPKCGALGFEVRGDSSHPGFLRNLNRLFDSVE